MRQAYIPARNFLEVLIHIICWGIMFGFPFVFTELYDEHADLLRYLHLITMLLSFVIVFYVNYFILVPRYLFNGKTRKYILNNLLLLCLIGFLMHFWQTIPVEADQEHHGAGPMPPRWLFFLRDTLLLVVTVGLSAVIRMSMRWSKAEAVRKETELKNLRNQLNPHFLLNTLNNIYALITFNTEKAQLAVQELSKLLAYVLYDNQQTYVPLYKEVDFIHNYIELMRLRLATNVKVNTCIDIKPDNHTLVAPLIFISLIENAFKHGISPTENSFVNIQFTMDQYYLTCHIQNTNYPKTTVDKSGPGLGLEQVRRRLELLYPNNYVWETNLLENETIYDTKLSVKIK